MAGPRILMVDDSEDDVLLASAQIRRWVRDARFRRVDNGAALERALREEQWDMVLCDHNMPSFDSTAALNLVRELDKDLPFFVYSGDFTRAQTEDALKSGAQGVLEKRDTSGLTRAICEAMANADTRPAMAD